MKKTISIIVLLLSMQSNVIPQNISTTTEDGTLDFDEHVLPTVHEAFDEVFRAFPSAPLSAEEETCKELDSSNFFKQFSAAVLEKMLTKNMPTSARENSTQTKSRMMSNGKLYFYLEKIALKKLMELESMWESEEREFSIRLKKVGDDLHKKNKILKEMDVKLATIEKEIESIENMLIQLNLEKIKLNEQTEAEPSTHKYDDHEIIDEQAILPTVVETSAPLEDETVATPASEKEYVFVIVPETVKRTEKEFVHKTRKSEITSGVRSKPSGQKNNPISTGSRRKNQGRPSQRTIR